MALLATVNAFAGDASCLQERAARVLASAYESGNPEDSPFNYPGEKLPILLGDIVAKDKAVTITREHSITDEEEVPIELKGYGAVAAWLSRLHTPDEHGYVYGIEARTLGRCVAGCCDFPLIHGVSHNTLYLLKACFGDDNGRPYLKEVYLYDGD